MAGQRSHGKAPSTRRIPTADHLLRSDRHAAPDLDVIADAAAELFYEYGYGNTSMQDLAEALGVAKPTLYAHGRSKVEILGHIFDRVLSQAEEVIYTAAVEGDALQALRQIVSGLTQLSVAHASAYGVFHDEQRELPSHLRGRYRAWSRYCLEGVRSVIARGQEADRLRSDIDAVVTAYTVVGACLWAARWLDPAGQLPVHAVGDQFTTLFLDGLVTRAIPDHE